eukprot:scpid65941/ scgid33687/ 
MDANICNCKDVQDQIEALKIISASVDGLLLLCVVCLGVLLVQVRRGKLPTPSCCGHMDVDVTIPAVERHDKAQIPDNGRFLSSQRLVDSRLNACSRTGSGLSLAVRPLPSDPNFSEFGPLARKDSNYPMHCDENLRAMVGSDQVSTHAVDEPEEDGEDGEDEYIIMAAVDSVYDRVPNLKAAQAACETRDEGRSQSSAQ